MRNIPLEGTAFQVWWVAASLLALCTPKEVGQKLALCQRKGLNHWAFPGYCKGYDAINLPGMMTSFNVLNELVLCLSILSPCTTIARMIFHLCQSRSLFYFNFSPLNIKHAWLWKDFHHDCDPKNRSPILKWRPREQKAGCLEGVLTEKICAQRSLQR